MAIIKKERSFSQIMGDVEVNEVPIIFVKKLSILSTEQKVYTLVKNDLSDFSSLEEAINSFPHEIQDINIELDMKLIEDTVKYEQNRLLGGNSKEDD